MAKSSKPTPRGRKPVAVLAGTANGPLTVEIQITDSEYVLDALADDIKYQRVWTVGEADAKGWRKFVFSADGPKGDPWQIGKIRLAFEPDAVDQHLRNLSEVNVKRAEG